MALWTGQALLQPFEAPPHDHVVVPLEDWPRDRGKRPHPALRRLDIPVIANGRAGPLNGQRPEADALELAVRHRFDDRWPHETRRAYVEAQPVGKCAPHDDAVVRAEAVGITWLELIDGEHAAPPSRPVDRAVQLRPHRIDRRVDLPMGDEGVGGRRHIGLSGYWAIGTLRFNAMKHIAAAALVALVLVQTPRSGNPILSGWYADPEARIFENQYWIYPTYSAPYEQQTFFDAFSSSARVTCTTPPRIAATTRIGWATRAVWAPSIVEKDGAYYLFFGANDIQNDNQLGGIGVARATHSGGPFEDHLGKPLVDKFHNGAQPID